MCSGEYLQSFCMFADGILIAKCTIGTHSNRWLTSVRYIPMETTIAAANERTNCVHAVRVESTISDAQCTFVNIFAQLILIFVGHRLCIVAVRMIPIKPVRAWFASESGCHINALSECIARLMHFTLKLDEKFNPKKCVILATFAIPRLYLRNGIYSRSTKIPMGTTRIGNTDALKFPNIQHLNRNEHQKAIKI